MLAGHVDDAGRRALLETASVLAYPSIYEGFGFPLLEAMSAGLPVVAARAGSIPEVAADAALLVEPTDERGLAEALDRVLTDDALRMQLVARGRDRVEGVLVVATTALRALGERYRQLIEVGPPELVGTVEGRGSRGPAPPAGSRRHRALHPVVAAHAAVRGSRRRRVRGRRPAGGRARAVSLGSTSARRTGASATRAGTGSADRGCASTPT